MHKFSYMNMKKTADEIMKNVDHPSHYQSKAGIEVIDVIEAFGLGFCTGNVVKYVCRCGKKTDNELQELEKAKWYLEREIKNRRAAMESKEKQA